MQMLLNLSFRALFLVQERQNTAEIDKRARISLFPWCKLNIREQTRTKLPQHLKRARVPTQLLEHVKLPRKDSCIQDYSAIAQRLHAQYCTQYNTTDIKIKIKIIAPVVLTAYLRVQCTPKALTNQGEVASVYRLRSLL